jgi:DUF438 domain-containing protein
MLSKERQIGYDKDTGDPMNDKLEGLFDYILQIRNDEGSIELFKAHEAQIKALEAIELFELFNRLLQLDEPKAILPYLDKLMHIFAQGLLSKQRQLPEGSILHYLHRENEAMKLKLNAIQTVMHAQLQAVETKTLLPLFCELETFTLHYLKIQNVLFPHLEKADERCTGLKIMWSLQDQTKATLKQILVRLPEVTSLDTDLIILIGNYFFNAFGLIQKEEMILFQIAMDLLDESELELIKAQSAEFDPCFIEALPKVAMNVSPETTAYFTSETGHLSFDQLKLMMNALPVDLTLIDENDKVCYFNTTSDRLFPRSAAVIGRNVRNCHPAESVHVVNEILSAFKNNTRQEATFWIHMKEKFILIKYVALRDKKQLYQGCLEITQEISEIQALSGNKRLLDWN